MLNLFLIQMASTIQELGLEKLVEYDLDFLKLALQPGTKPQISPQWTETYASTSTFWENKYGKKSDYTLVSELTTILN